MSLHPNSLANLEFKNGSEPRYSEPKKRRHITVTNSGWDNAKSNLKAELNLSVSETVELIGRGKLKVVKIDQ